MFIGQGDYRVVGIIQMDVTDAGGVNNLLSISGISTQNRHAFHSGRNRRTIVAQDSSISGRETDRAAHQRLTNRKHIRACQRRSLAIIVEPHDQCKGLRTYLLEIQIAIAPELPSRERVI